MEDQLQLPIAVAAALGVLAGGALLVRAALGLPPASPWAGPLRSYEGSSGEAAPTGPRPPFA